MNSRLRIQQTLANQNTGRAARDLWLLPWAVDHHKDAVESIAADYPRDITNAPAFLQTTPPTKGDPYRVGTYVDEWGCIFEQKQDGIIGEVKEPLVHDWTQADQVRIPKESLTVDTNQVNKFCRDTEKFVIGGCCPRPFERMQFIRTTQALYMDLVDQPKEFLRLLERIHEHFKAELELWGTTDVDALMFMDDWGAQRSLLISPSMWRDFFKPLYKDYIDIAHKHGKFIFMHSDGFILDILPDLIELGLDAVNSQIFCMGLDKLRPFKGSITFWGELDRQHLLPYGDREAIVQAVTDIKDNLYEQGGVIAQCEFGIGAKPENVRTMFETWDRLTN